MRISECGFDPYERDDGIHPYSNHEPNPKYGVDMIWFGIIMVFVVEMGLITPPIGMNVFTVRAVMPDIKLDHIFKGVIPIVFADVTALILFLTFPVIAIGLVGLLRY